MTDADPLYREALGGRRRTLGDAHPNTLSIMSILAMLLHARGKLAEAEQLSRLCLDGRRRVLGKTHESTLNASAGLAEDPARARRQGRRCRGRGVVRPALIGPPRRHRGPLKASARGAARLLFTLHRFSGTNPACRLKHPRLYPRPLPLPLPLSRGSRRRRPRAARRAGRGRPCARWAAGSRRRS